MLRYLQSGNQLEAVAAPALPTGAPSLLLWGAPVDGPQAEDVAFALRDICIDLHEVERKLTEPDVALVWDDLALIVEVKHRSGNDHQPHYRNFATYLDRPDLFCVSPEVVRSTGYYELVRNWRIGCELGERLDKPFELVNLGPPAIRSSAAAFEQTLSQTHRRTFAHRTWAELLSKIGALEPWFETFCRGRKLA